MYYIVYGITDCPSCLIAQAKLMERDKEYVFVNTDFSKTYRNDIREKLNWPTFPIIVMIQDQNNTLIGGADELSVHLGKQLGA